LLPTPITTDHKQNNSKSAINRKSPLLGAAVHMLPTPQTGDGQKGMTSTPEHRQATGHQVMLSNHAPQLSESWGKFEPAIRRWEQTIQREAPAPTKPDGKDGNQRLSAEFTEWLMGLPKGWITDCDITRKEQLKACGNGVVPQQAKLALEIMDIKL
jgi:DNA (cytosine-5)-methyltransferase 1